MRGSGDWGRDQEPKAGFMGPPAPGPKRKRFHCEYLMTRRKVYGRGIGEKRSPGEGGGMQLSSQPKFEKAVDRGQEGFGRDKPTGCRGSEGTRKTRNLNYPGRKLEGKEGLLYQGEGRKKQHKEKSALPDMGRPKQGARRGTPSTRLLSNS